MACLLRYWECSIETKTLEGGARIRFGIPISKLRPSEVWICLACKFLRTGIPQLIGESESGLLTEGEARGERWVQQSD